MTVKGGIVCANEFLPSHEYGELWTSLRLKVGKCSYGHMTYFGYITRTIDVIFYTNNIITKSIKMKIQERAFFLVVFKRQQTMSMTCF